MKKYQYIVAAACILIGAAGFAGIYAIDQMQEDKTRITQQTETEETKDTGIDLVDVGEPPYIEESEEPAETEGTEVADAGDDLESVEDPETPVAIPQEETLHFSKDGLMWPIEGTVLLDYSMDATIYFPTLNQYQYHPAVVLAGAVNSKVYFIAKGKITDISTNEVTGCTVTQDLGDGYTAVYGQLKELNYKTGDTVEAGQVVGYVSEPTKYYAVEGSNVYFQLLKDGVPVDPESILP